MHFYNFDHEYRKAVQQNLGFIPLEKIDPNTQETISHDSAFGTNALSPAVIPAILLGIYNMLEMGTWHGCIGSEGGI